jgi:hypothetical protein
MDKIRFSIVHLEYPTNFKFSRKESNAEGEVRANGRKKTRGNFDLVILKGPLLTDIANKNINKLIEFLTFIISKNVAKYESIYNLLGHPLGELIDYAIEVKFFHFSNTTQDMFDEVKIDNFKLEQSIDLKANIKPVNLIFCYYWSDGNKNKKWEGRLKYFRKNLTLGKIGIEQEPQNLIPEKVLNIFIEANINPNAVKKTQRPVCYFNHGMEKLPEWVRLLTKGYKINL